MTALVPTSAALPAVTEETAELIGRSVSPNTLRAYQGHLTRLNAAGLDLSTLDDASLANWLGSLHAAGKTAATIAQALAAIRFALKLNGLPLPTGQLTPRTMAGIRRSSHSGRGQAKAVSLEDMLAMQAAARLPRKRGRGMETPAVAAARAVVDIALIGVAFQGGLRRSEIAALEWRDVEPATITGALRIRVRTSKTNQTGENTDIRLVKNGSATALKTLKAAAVKTGQVDTDKVFGGMSDMTINRRLQASAKAAGIDGISAHSFRVGLASELTARGASTAETMLSGGWKTARMVAHYSAGSKAERGGVAKYF